MRNIAILQTKSRQTLHVDSNFVGTVSRGISVSRGIPWRACVTTCHTSLVNKISVLGHMTYSFLRYFVIVKTVPRFQRNADNAQTITYKFDQTLSLKN